jgi:hypothetical protein
MTGDKTGATPATPKAKSTEKRRSVSTKRMYWAIVDYIQENGINEKDALVVDLLDALKDDVLKETR